MKQITFEQLLRQQQEAQLILNSWIKDLEDRGFVYNKELSGMSAVYDHPDGSQVWLDF